jgi:uncharacterized lipoprotein YmbA
MKKWSERAGVRGMAAVAAALGALAALSACASTAPLRYYTLSDVPPATEGASASSASPALRVGRVRIPGEIDRTELVQRIDATRVKIAEQDKWAAPLDEMIRRALSADLQTRGAAQSASATLSVDIEEFIGDAACAVTLRASWELKPAAADNTAPARTGQELIRVPPSSGTCTVAALPMAMSQALAQLSDRVLAGAR